MQCAQLYVSAAAAAAAAPNSSNSRCLTYATLAPLPDHFHERLRCLYTDTGEHSSQVGQALDDKPIFGKWENYTASQRPNLDACGGHFGVTPTSNGATVYHYHVQDTPPFTIGCYGPDRDSSGAETLVTVDKCRSLYSECGDDTTSLTSTSGTVSYDLYCPCYDGAHSNTGSQQLAVFTSGTDLTTCTTCQSGDTVPGGSTSAAHGLHTDSHVLVFLGLTVATNAICALEAHI